MRRTPPALALLLCCLATAATADPALDAARAQIAAGALPEAQIGLKNLLARDANNAEARLLLATIQLQLRNGAIAQQEVERALALGLPREQALPVLAEAMLQQGQAQRVVDEIVPLDSAPPALLAQVWTMRGEAFDGLGNTAEATLAYERARQADPGNARARMGLARVAFQQRDLPRAEALLTEALTADPKAANALEMQGEIRYLELDPAGAEAAFSQAIAVAPAGWTAWFKRAVVRLDRGDLAGAEQDLTEFERLNPDFPGVKLVRGRLMLAKGDVPAAAYHFELYANAMPGDIQGLYYAAEALFRLKRPEAARAYLDRYLAGAPATLEGMLPAARLRLQSGDGAGAIALLNPVLGKADSPAADDVLMAAFMQQERLDDAVRVARRMLGRTDKQAAQVRAAAAVLARKGDWAAVASAAQALVTLDGNALADRLLLVDALVRAQQGAEALTAATALATDLPGEARAQQALGLAALAAGKLDESRAAFQRAIDLDPTLEGPALSLARLDAATGDSAGARKQLEALAGARPDSTVAVLELARQDQAEGQPAAAEERLRKAVQAAPENPQLRMALAGALLADQQAPAALAVLEEAPKAAEAPALLRLRAALEAATGQRQAAVATCERLVALAPKDPDARLLLIRARAGAGDTKGLGDDLLKTITEAPESPLVQPALLAVYNALDQEARGKLLEAAGTVIPKQPGYLYLLGTAAYEAGDRATALSQLRAAQQAAPQWSAPVTALIGIGMAGNERAEAERIAKDWFKRNPKDAQVRLTLASAYLQQNDTAAAITHYRAALAAQPDLPVALNNLAMLTMASDPKGALEMAERAVKLAPQDVDLKDTLATVLLATGRADDALALLKPLHAAQPENPILTYRYASALAATGETGSARQLLLGIVALNFSERAAAEALLATLSAGK